jgi:hypothetical protein
METANVEKPLTQGLTSFNSWTPTLNRPETYREGPFSSIMSLKSFCVGTTCLKLNLRLLICIGVWDSIWVQTCVSLRGAALHINWLGALLVTSFPVSLVKPSSSTTLLSVHWLSQHAKERQMSVLNFLEKGLNSLRLWGWEEFVPFSDWWKRAYDPVCTRRTQSVVSWRPPSMTCFLHRKVGLISLTWQLGKCFWPVHQQVTSCSHCSGLCIGNMPYW